MNQRVFLHRFASLATAVTLLHLSCGTTARAQAADDIPPGTLTVMTYNLRFASLNPPNAWPVRRPLVREVIEQIAPDVFGTQEGVYSQLKDLAADLPDYDWIGLGREGGSKGEFMAVFYRKARFEPMAYDHFWLSDTPEVIASSTWGNTCRRMVTWVKFFDRDTEREFYLWNTHFDHEVQAAREKAAKLVRQRVAALNDKLPLILTGDFNAAGGTNEAYKILTADGFFSDTWMTAKSRKGEGLNTFNSFKAIQRAGIRIDWILTRGEFVVDSTEIVTFSRDGQFPSDHFPLVTRLRLSAAK
jgi:endonuclease/exonuclease/phosphatase family metal-dependent hydrolase